MLTIIREVGLNSWGRKAVLCACDCGKEVTVALKYVKSGHTRSCGCARVTNNYRLRYTHGQSHTDEHNIWQGMKQRCYNENVERYPNYGGRGITVCAEWLNDFQQFYRDMGPRPSKFHSIDRINNDGPYSPENCRWATVSQQQRNKRRTVFLTANGERRSLSEWAELRGFSHITFFKRYQAGWSDEEIVNTPKLARTCPKPRGHRRHRRNSVSAK